MTRRVYITTKIYKQFTNKSKFKQPFQKITMHNEFLQTPAPSTFFFSKHCYALYEHCTFLDVKINLIIFKGPKKIKLKYNKLLFLYVIN